MAAPKKKTRKTQKKYTLRVRTQAGALDEIKGVSLSGVIDEARNQFLKFEFSAHPLARILVYIRKSPTKTQIKGELLVLAGVKHASLINTVYQRDIINRGDHEVAEIFELHPMWDYRPPKNLQAAIANTLH